MRPSRGMGAVRASKMPGGKKITRKDDPNEVMTYAKGGKVKESDEDDKTQDKAMVKKAFKQHDAQQHKNGKATKLALKKGGKMATGGVVLGNGGGYKTGGVADSNGGGYKTGGVVLGNGGGYKAGGKAAKKAYATGGPVNNSGRAVAMPQGSKKPQSPVSISKLAGTYKKGGRATPAERREESAFNSENATAMRQSKADSNLKYKKGGAVTERDLQIMESIGDPTQLEMMKSRLSRTGSISAEEARRMAGMRTPSGAGSISDAETKGYEDHYAREKADNEADAKAMHDMMMYLPNKAADLFHRLHGQGAITNAELGGQGAVTDAEKAVK